MTSFAFNFSPTSTEGDNESGDRDTAVLANPATEPKPNDGIVPVEQIDHVNDTLTAHTGFDNRRSVVPFYWLENVNHYLEERSQQELMYTEIPIDPDLPALCYVDWENTLDPIIPDSQNDSSISIESWRYNDIQPAVYEGGMKVWECSLDLVKYLSEQCSRAHSPLADTTTPSLFDACNVLELGCGHALPSCWLLREHVRQQTPSFTITFTDYNDFVIRGVTLSNIILNTSPLWTTIDDRATPPPTSLEKIASHIRLGYGDWLDMSKQMQSMSPFDLILAAETMYTEQAAEEMAILLTRHLCPLRGLALIATKRYYFGVGGGSDAFHAMMLKYPLRIETVQTYDTGMGNIREILRVTLTTVSNC